MLRLVLEVSPSPQLRRRVLAASLELYGSQAASSERKPGSTPWAIGDSR
jgi:hypothetical protein